MDLDQTIKLAVEYQQAGRLREAESLYRQILSIEPKQVDALHLLGLIAHQIGQWTTAEILIRRALAIAPRAPFYNSLGSVLVAQGRHIEAASSYESALAIAPDYMAYANLGHVMLRLGRFDHAVGAYQSALKLAPSHADLWLNVSFALDQLGRVDDAIEACRRAIALEAQSAEGHNRLGLLLRRQNNLREAVAELKTAIDSEPAFDAAHNNMGIALHDLGDLDLAEKSCRTAISLKPGLSSYQNNLAAVLKDQGSLDEAIATLQKAIAAHPDDRVAHSSLLYTMHFHPSFDAAAILTEHRRWNEAHAKQFAPERSEIHERDVRRPLRIGFVSPHLRWHPVGRFLLPLLQYHQGDALHITCYSEGATRADPVTRHLREIADAWLDTAGLSDEQLAAQIRADRIDILFDLTMHMDGSRLLVFARKPAPVQATYLAYCSTTGLETIDFRLSDPWFDAPGEDEGVYSERTIRLRHSYWCYEPPASAPDVVTAPLQQNGYVTFGCLNNFSKVTAPALERWQELLGRLPKARLVLSAGLGVHRQRVIDFFGETGIVPDRIEFVGRLSFQEYLALHNRIDVALDPFPCSGGTTTCDALWMGVPVVTRIGRTAVGRGGVSVMSNLGLGELVATSDDAYVDLALALAQDEQRLASLRREMRERMLSSPLMNGPQFARHMEDACREMWQRATS